MKLASITHCTSKKSVISDFALMDRFSNQGELESVWLEAISNAPNLMPARSLYTGRGFQLVSNTCPGEHLFIVSAGLGLVRAETSIPAYNLTISSGHNDSLDQYCEQQINLIDWWSSLAKNKFSEGFLHQLVENYDHVILSVTSEYLKLIAEDLALCRDKVILVSAPTSAKKWCDLVRVAPYDGAFDGPDGPISGTKGDFAQRCHADLLTRFSETSNVDMVLDQVSMDMNQWRQPIPINNKTCSDDEILALIQKWRSNFSSINSLHKHFRHELGVACEQKRFTKLVKSLEA